MEAASPIDALAEVLGAEERLYQELRDLLQAERDAMADVDPVRLGELVQLKEGLAEEARFLEENRLAVCQTLAQELGTADLSDCKPRLSELCERLGERAAPLLEVHRRLVALLTAVQELVDANAVFAGRSLAQVRTTLRLFGRMLPPEPGYGPSTQVPARPGRIVRETA